MKALKSMIVNADDYGLTAGINRGIIQCHREGIVTSTSIMANGSCFEDAVRLAFENKTLGIGIHLVLVGETPIADRNRIRSLIGKDGRLLESYKDFLLKYLHGNIDIREISDEVEAQIKKVVDTGIKPTHLDSHQHLHMLPGIMSVMVELAKKYNIPCVRMARPGLNDVIGVKNASLFFMSMVVSGKIKRSEMFHADRILGLKESGCLKQGDLLRLIREAKHGVSELMCHPGYKDITYNEHYSDWHYQPEAELAALTAGEVKEAIKQYGLCLVNYGSLSKS